jgi:putative aldouronate transport system permease protein
MRTLEDKRWAFVGHICMIILSILALAPFVLLIIASFTDEAAAIRNGTPMFLKVVAGRIWIHFAPMGRHRP